ncbi:MAG: hypothetical protein [Olavius algarvensis Delta 4 endosymbiont]|nr:MAG: hypothetical protein [Olavius algarvensis Delta 4 endosymbiont]
MLPWFKVCLSEYELPIEIKGYWNQPPAVGQVDVYVNGVVPYQRNDRVSTV